MTTYPRPTLDSVAIVDTATIGGALTSSATGIAATFSGAGAIKPPAGTLAQRPTTGTSGALRWNTTNGTLEVDNGTIYVSLPTNTLRVNDLTALKAYDTTGISTAEFVAIMSHAGSTVANGGCLFDWSSASTTTPDDILVVRPTGISGSNPGRWIRRLDSDVIPAEAAGVLGNYVFPTAGSGEVLGNDNTTAFTNLFNAASTQSTSKRDCTVKLGVGIYRITGNVAIPPGVLLEGVGSYLSAGPGDARMNAGTIILYDGGDALVSPDTGVVIRGVKFMRRGMDLSPTSGEVDAYWAARLNDLCAGKQWLPTTAYSVNDIRINLNNVYKCNTSGTSGATNTGGPLGQSTTASSITDGTAAWQFLHEATWERSTAYPVNTYIINQHRVYQCDTAGTSASTGNGPSGTTATTNGITDGTAKWHWIGTLSLAIRPTSHCRVEDCSIVGFSRAIAIKEGINLTNVVFDALLGIDQQNSGDMCVYDSVKARAVYTVSGATLRRHGVAFYCHSRVDGVQYRSCGSQLWAVGLCVSNAWAQATACYIETDSTTRGDTCIQLRNVAQGFQASDNYLNGVICWDIAATNSSRASVAPPAGVTSTSEINIQGGWLISIPAASYSGAADAAYTPTHFRVTGAVASGQIRGPMINAQGRVPFQFYAVSAPSLGEISWVISDGEVTEAAYPDYTLARLATIDSSVVPYVTFDNMRHANNYRLIVPPGYDRTLDYVSSPSGGGSHTVSNGARLCRLNGGGVLATYTVTMPDAPLDGQLLTISSKTAITTLTVSGSGGDTVASAPTAATAEQCFTFRYLKVDTIWLRIA